MGGGGGVSPGRLKRTFSDAAQSALLGRLLHAPGTARASGRRSPPGGPQGPRPRFPWGHTQPRPPVQTNISVPLWPMRATYSLMKVPD